MQIIGDDEEKDAIKMRSKLQNNQIQEIIVDDEKPKRINKKNIVSNIIDDQQSQQQRQEQDQKTIEKKQRKASYKATVLNLFKSFIGSGIIAMPYSFYKGGILLSSFIFLIISILINFSQNLVVRLAESTNRETTSYCDMIEFSLGKSQVQSCKVFIILTQWGCCVSYVIFFMQFFEYAFYESNQPKLGHQLIYLCLALIIILPMTLINNMALFVKISTIANGLIAITFIYVFSTAISSIQNNSQQYIKSKTNLANFDQMSTIIGVSIYAFEAVGIILTVKHSMKKAEKFLRLLKIVTAAAVLLNICFAVLCSLGFGSDTNQIVLFSLPKQRFDASFVQVTYALSLVMSFPLQLFPAFQIVEELETYQKYFKLDDPVYKFKRTITRIIQVLIICFIALGVPSFALFLSFIGGLGGTSLQFLYPYLAYVKILWPKRSKKQNIQTSIVMILGMIFGMFAMIDSFISIVS